MLLRDTTNVLLEGVPGGIKLPELRASIAGLPGVAGVHDLHVWSMTTDDVNCTAHVTLAEGADPDAVRRSVAATLDSRFGIEHCAIQTEGAAEGCDGTNHLHPGRPFRQKRSRWTEEADTELRLFIAARQPLATIAKEMGRTMDGVRGRCTMLQLTLSSPTRPWLEAVRRGPQPERLMPPRTEGD